MVPEGGRAVALVTHAAEGALRVPALPVGAEVLVPALVDIFTLVFGCGQLVALPTGTPEGALGVSALPVDAQIPLLTLINIWERSSILFMSFFLPLKEHALQCLWSGVGV